MGKMISPETLRRYPFFASLETDVIKEFAMAGEIVEFVRDAWVFHCGEKAEAFYLILEGSIEIRTALGSEGTRQIGVSTLKRGEMFGWSALVDPYVYQMGAATLSKCKLARFNGVALCELMTHRPDVGYILITRVTNIIGNRLMDLRVRFVSLIEGERWQRLAVRPSVIVEDGGHAKPPESR